MSDSIQTVGKKVKALVNPLRDEGIGAGAYLEQITYLLFLKMIDEYTKPPYNKPLTIPKDCTWEELKSLSGDKLDKKYKYILETLGKKDGMLKEIYLRGVRVLRKDGM